METVEVGCGRFGARPNRRRCMILGAQQEYVIACPANLSGYVDGQQ
jgi:hypothetical protein